MCTLLYNIIVGNLILLSKWSKDRLSMQKLSFLFKVLHLYSEQQAGMHPFVVSHFSSPCMDKRATKFGAKGILKSQSGSIHILRNHIFRMFGLPSPYVSMFLVLKIIKYWHFMTPLPPDNI